ncbi:MAG TPA: protein CapI, partial [Lachnospiraceae bacterium]|nr:protein CapI [Lachnospiraceae bacterium]
MKAKVDLNNKSILVTGSPGFIGANLVLRLLKELSGGTIVSLDNMNDYYEPSLKEYRLCLIEDAARDAKSKHIFVNGSIADKALVENLFNEYK